MKKSTLMVLKTKLIL